MKLYWIGCGCSIRSSSGYFDSINFSTYHVLLAVILPGNQVLPFGDLATIPFVVAFIVGAARGNIIHSVIVGTIMIAISLYIATDVAPIFTEYERYECQMPKGSSEISSIDQGGNIVNYLIFKLFSLFN